MRKYLLAISVALIFSSCEVHHFINDVDYRKQVAEDLGSRLSNNAGLKQFYKVDSLLITTEEKEALQFLYAYMPLADFTDYSTDFYLDNVQQTFRTRNEMGWNVPEREFRHFVLPLRVNNENLDTARMAFYRR